MIDWISGPNSTPFFIACIIAFRWAPPTSPCWAETNCSYHFALTLLSTKVLLVVFQERQRVGARDTACKLYVREVGAINLHQPST